jgi:small-conductance mechanosensitive channel
MKIICDEAQKHPLMIDNRNKEEIENNAPRVIVRVISLSDFSVDLKAFVWTNSNSDAFILKCDLLKSVKQRFDKEGIEIPFPYRTIVYKKDLEDGKKSPEQKEN